MILYKGGGASEKPSSLLNYTRLHSRGGS